VLAFVLLGVAIAVATHDASMVFGLWCILAGVVGTLAVQYTRALVVARRAIEFSRENSRGIEALARRDFATARATFARLLDRTRDPRQRNTAEHNLAWTAFVDGRLADALASWENIERRLARDQATHSHHIAVVAALAGQLGRAGEAIQRVVALASAEHLTDPPLVDAWVKLAQAIVDLRGGEPRRAVVALESTGTLLRTRLPAELVPAVESLLALGHALTDSPRDATPPRPPLSTADRDRLRFLWVEWPEMRALLFSER
jgi:hypothetical protein